MLPLNQVLAKRNAPLWRHAGQGNGCDLQRVGNVATWRTNPVKLNALATERCTVVSAASVGSRGGQGAVTRVSLQPRAGS